MARSGVSDAIWIEDEVWDEAFATRVAATRRRGGEIVARERIISPERRARALAPVPAPPAPAPAPPAPAPAPPAPAAVEPVEQPVLAMEPLEPERRTVRIQGRGAERNLPWPGEARWAGESPRRRPPRSLHERAAFRPDRLAMWAVFLGLLLVLMAALSAH
jgi:hypothetical protein